MEQSENICLFRNFIPESKEVAEDPNRLTLTTNTLYPTLGRFKEYLDEFGQIRLMSEESFVDWAKERRVPVSRFGLYDSDPSLFWKLGWMRADDAELQSKVKDRGQEDVKSILDFGNPIGSEMKPAGRWNFYRLRFHPFRIYPLIRILDIMEWNLRRSNALYAPGVYRYSKDYIKIIRQVIRSESFPGIINNWNGVADLGILLEPIYWPKITSKVRRPVIPQPIPSKKDSDEYKSSVLAILSNIPKARVAQAHMELRHKAALLDDNSELYLLLRCASWEKRNQIKGNLGSALWLRHLAEVIRHGYDELYDDKLVHEDEAFGFWHAGAREWVYGSDYPLSNTKEIVRRILPRWGIAASPRVRFYVEGHTEQGALESALAPHLGFGIEIVNLTDIGWEDRFKQMLEADQKARRISLIMVDGDDEKPLKMIRLRVREQLVVGMVFLNKPDIEFGSFDLSGLIEATKIYEQELGRVGLPELSVAQFESVKNGKEFDKRYQKIRQCRSLKGAIWGRALMQVARLSIRNGMDESNPLVFAFKCALRSVETDYDVQRTKVTIDPETLESVQTGNNLF